MDQMMVDCGDDDVQPGDDAVLIGAQGGERIRAEDWAAALGTIGYEIVCGVSARVPRRYSGGPPPPGEPHGGAR
jgi:alanine racemase